LSLPAEQPRPRREVALAALFFLAYTVLATWPQAAHLSGAMADLWDAKLSAWILHWDYAQTLRDPGNLFQAPFFHPSRYVLAFSENFYGAAVFGFPLLAGGASLVFNYNVLLLLGMFLSGLSAWALARYVTNDPGAALVGGVVYAFLPYKLSQLAHFHMEWGPFLPLVFLFLLRYLDGGRRGDAVRLGVAFAWNAIACIQYAFFTGFLIVIVLGLEAFRAGTSRRRIGGAVLAIFLGFLAFLPFAIPYEKASKLYGMRRTIGEMTFFSAKPGYFLSAGERNKFWGPLTARWRGPEGDFFPGLIPLVLAGIAVVRLRRAAPSHAPEAEISPERLKAARMLDVGCVLLLGAWIAARLIPNLRIGPLSLGDPGRVQVFLTMAILTRLALAFPKRGRYRSLADFFESTRLDRRVLLLLIVGFAGILVSLGGNTPYYRFLFQSFGSVFRAIRVAGRGIVLFQVALAVLAAWGLSLLSRDRSLRARGAWLAGTIALMTVEYRAFPILMFEYDSSAVPAYEWLCATSIEGGVVEWPFGFPYDCEYTFRQAEHDKPLINGHSSFAPKPYENLYALFHRRPISDAIWPALAELDAKVLVYHPHAVEPVWAVAYRRAVREGVESGKIAVVSSFAHGSKRDFVFRLEESAQPRLVGVDRNRAETELAELLALPDSSFSPPFAGIAFPAPVVAGAWHGGWALDDSGIAEVRIASEIGPAGSALLHMRHGGLAKNYPDFAEAVDDKAGFGFPIPNLPPGSHTLTFTVIANDDGVTVLTRPITVVAPPAQPRSR
jgi:hypothetical protein